MVKLSIIFSLTMRQALSGCSSKRNAMTNLDKIKSTYEGKTSEEIMIGLPTRGVGHATQTHYQF